MAFRATNTLPVRGYDTAKQTASGLKRFASTQSAAIAGGGDGEQVVGIVDSLVSFKASLSKSAAIPGIGDYAQEQEDDPAYDVAAEFTTLMGLIDDAISEIVTTIPKEVGTDFLLLQTINADGTRVSRDFTGPQLAGIKADLDSIDAAIV